MLIGGGHRASRTRRSAVKTHTRRADWLGMDEGQQHRCNADRPRPSGVTRKAISRGGRQPFRRLAQPRNEWRAPARAMLKVAAHGRHARSDQPPRHAPDVQTHSAWRHDRRWPSGVTHEGISRGGTRTLCRLARHGGRRAAPARTMLIGGGHQASRTRRSAVKAGSRLADWRGLATDGQHQCEKC